ncbi:hypothetical protein ACLKA7_005968 [Drosophila subpalustris]
MPLSRELKSEVALTLPQIGGIVKSWQEAQRVGGAHDADLSSRIAGNAPKRVGSTVQAGNVKRVTPCLETSSNLLLLLLSYDRAQQRLQSQLPYGSSQQTLDTRHILHCKY